MPHGGNGKPGDCKRAQRVARVMARSATRPASTRPDPISSQNVLDGVGEQPEDGCEIWAPTQIPIPVRATVARQLELSQDSVIVHVTRVGGGFGRRLSAKFILEAVQIAREVREPVQVVWTREDDMRHGGGSLPRSPSVAISHTWSRSRSTLPDRCAAIASRPRSTADGR